MAFMNDFGVVMRLGPSAGLSPEEMMHRCSESSQRWPFSLRVGWEGRPFPPNAVGTHPPHPHRRGKVPCGFESDLIPHLKRSVLFVWSRAFSFFLFVVQFHLCIFNFATSFFLKGIYGIYIYIQGYITYVCVLVLISFVNLVLRTCGRCSRSQRSNNTPYHYRSLHYAPEWK